LASASRSRAVLYLAMHACSDCSISMSCACMMLVPLPMNQKPTTQPTPSQTLWCVGRRPLPPQPQKSYGLEILGFSNRLRFIHSRSLLRTLHVSLLQTLHVLRCSYPPLRTVTIRCRPKTVALRSHQRWCSRPELLCFTRSEWKKCRQRYTDVDAAD
jgi:hypothetical protein